MQRRIIKHRGESKPGIFSSWQPQYAAHNIATFPVTITEETKKPAVKGYGRVGLRGSAELARKSQFADASDFGFMTGPRSNITVLDVDTPDERVLADALDRHGQTSVIVRSGSGNHQAWYRHNGERRRIRPWRGLPIDVLGSGGLVVAAPSQGAKGQYEIIQGSLDDLDRLPVMRNLVELPASNSELVTNLDARQGSITEGQRNNALWRHCMRAAHHVDDFDVLLDVGESGRNYFGQHAAWILKDEVNKLVSYGPDVLGLLTYLRANQGPDATFMCTNSLAEKFGLHRVRFAEARRQLIGLGYLKPVRQAGRGTPALFRWGR